MTRQPHRTHPVSTLALALVTVVAAATTSALARAESAPDANARPRALAPVPIEQGASATAWGIAGYHLGLGVGARMTLPVADGFLPPSAPTDLFAIDVGADYLRFQLDDTANVGDPSHDRNASLLRPVAGLLWALRLGEHVALYPKLELGWNVPRADARRASDAGRYAGLHVEGVAGVMLSLGRFALRAESGWGYVKAGLGFAI